MTITLVVATHNEGKLVEIQRVLEAGLGPDAASIKLVSAASLNLPDPVETGTSFQSNALLKARAVARRTGFPAIADDSGLIVDVMGAAPGILSARWSGVHGHDAANNALLLAQLEDIPDGKRTARFVCAAALVVPKPGRRGQADALGDANDRGGQAHELAWDAVQIGEMPGVVIRGPRGERGFGYDPLFVPDDQPGRRNEAGEPLTSAEMTPAEKNAISHRAKAFEALAPAVRRLLG